ncbi:uncharacterized protein VTP21DRAFT_10924 [Calcarisporiella thermophila]|uniref:uncharacterized protein n=1 Tax=Calcarisporiella thermophila TaxID=911321 RepID=UPI0037436FAA
MERPLIAKSHIDDHLEVHYFADNAREYVLRTHRSLLSGLDFVMLTLLAAYVYSHRVFVVYAVSGALLLLWLWSKCNTVTQESLLIIRDLGIQVRTVYADGRATSQFIDRAKLSDIIINEGITLWQVKFYMALMVEGHDRLVVVFEHLLPRLKVLLEVYHGARAVMYGEPEGERNGIHHHPTSVY